jgi:hypothetical protein
LPEQKVSETPFEPLRAGYGGTPVIPTTRGNVNGRIYVKASLGKRQEPISKITKVKGAEGVAQVLENWQRPA